MLRRIRRAWIAAYVGMSRTILPSDGRFRFRQYFMTVVSRMGLGAAVNLNYRHHSG